MCSDLILSSEGRFQVLHLLVELLMVSSLSIFKCFLSIRYPRQRFKDPYNTYCVLWKVLNSSLVYFEAACFIQAGYVFYSW